MTLEIEDFGHRALRAVRKTLSPLRSGSKVRYSKSKIWIVPLVIAVAYAACYYATDELAPILDAPASIIFFAPSKSRTPPDAFTPNSGPTVLRISAMSSAVAPPVLNPVDVLT